MTREEEQSDFISHGPFSLYDSKQRSILCSIEQGGRYFWATDTYCSWALKDLITAKVIKFKCKTGILAEYIKGELWPPQSSRN